MELREGLHKVLSSCSRGSPTLLFRRSVTRQHLAVSLQNFSRLRNEPIFLHSYRFLTTPATDPTPKTTRSDLPHLQPASPRKQKIELRPAPVKASPQNQTTIPTVKTSGTTDTNKDTKNADGPVPEPGIVETAKIDYNEASMHGILAPPPPDASKIGKLWHQAKEYFVSCLRVDHHYPTLNAVFQKFYVRGLKLIITHRKQVNQILARVEAGGEPLSRWETRFIETHRADVRKSV